MNKLRFVVFIFVLGTLTPVFWLAHGQHGGLDYFSRYIAEPPFEVFLPDEHYDGSRQNWSAHQMDDGRMLFANSGGLLLYDGTGFQNLSDTLNLRDIIETDTGEIYLSGNQFFGRLETRSAGRWHIESLSDHLPKHSGPQVAWQLTQLDGNLYLRYSLGYIVFNPETKESAYHPFIMDEEQTGSNSFLEINNRILAVLGNRDLVEITDSGTEHVHQLRDSAARHCLLLPYYGIRDQLDQPTAILNAGGMFFTFNTTDENIDLFTTINEADYPDLFHLLMHDTPYSSSLLSSGYKAMYTVRGGVLFMDDKLQRILHLNSDKGLPSNTVLSMYEDRQGGVWLMTGKGLVRIDFHFPYWKSVVDREMNGPVYQVRFADEDLMVTTLEDAYFITSNGILDSGSDAEILSSRHNADVLFDDGIRRIITTVQQQRLFSVINRRFEPVENGVLWAEEMHGTLTNDNYPGYIIIPATSGVFYSYLEADGDKVYTDGLMKLPQPEGSYTNAFFDNHGDLWALRNGYEYVRFFSDDGSGSILNNPERVRYQIFPADDDELPHLSSAAFFGKNLKFFPENEPVAYQIKASADRSLDFTSDDFKKASFPYKVSSFHNKVELENTHLYVAILDGEDLSVFTKPDGTLEVSPFLNAYGALFRHTFSSDVKDGRKVLSGNNGMMVFQEELVEFYQPSLGFIPSIRRVYSSADSVYYSGSTPEFEPPSFAYDNNQFRFEFATGVPSFGGVNSAFQTRLIPKYPEWSDWSNRNVREFTSLSPGNYTFEVRARLRDGSVSEVKTYSFSVITPFYLSTLAWILYFLGFVLVIFLSSRKISDYRNKQTMQRMQAEQAEELRKIQQLRSRLFSEISHELRTPVTLISAPLQNLIHTKKLPEDSERQIQIALRNSERMTDLIEQISDLNRLESSKLNLFRETFDAGVFIRVLVQSFTSLADFNGLKLTESLPDQPSLIYADKDKFEKIITNLLANAIKFTPKGGSILVSLQKETNQWLIKISDTGIGIEENFQKTIFDPFVSLGNSDKQFRNGLGIGLMITKEYTELHGGEISVESKPGEGSTFGIRLPSDLPENAGNENTRIPINNAAQKKPDLIHEPDEKSVTGEKKILLVEDNHELRLYIREQLNNAGYDVDVAKNGREALKKLSDDLPDLIISDIMMPEMDGMELLRELKQSEQLRNIPVIFLSAKADLEGRLDSFRLGVNDYLIKPFNLQELLVRINNLITFSEERKNAVTEDDTQLSTPKNDNELIRNLRALIEERISEKDLNLEAIAPELAMSRSSLYRHIKKETGLSAAAFVREVKLQYARANLERGDYSTLKEAALSIGYTHSGYFSNLYEQRFGTRPKLT